MRVAYCYRGFFDINYYKNNGSDEKYLSGLQKILKNHEEFMIKELKDLGYSIDCFFSTYSSNKEVEETIRNNLQPKEYFIETQNMMNVSSHTSIAQLIHYKNIIRLIKEEEKKSEKEYDLVILLRPDIEFIKKYKELNISKDAFNISFIHQSKNCDDNFWIFDRIMLDSFNKSVNQLYNYKRITHEMNHALESNNVKCHYIDGQQEYSIFRIVRVV